MNIELKKYKPSPRLSEETLAFTAEIWIDGKKAADVSNHGTGGPNNYHFTDRKVGEAFYAFCKAQPKLKTDYGLLDMDADLYIGELCNKLDHEKWLTNKKKKCVLFKLPSHKPDEYGTTKLRTEADRPAAIRQVLTKYPTATIL